jgi:hypothetical protein
MEPKKRYLLFMVLRGAEGFLSSERAPGLCLQPCRRQVEHNS